MSQDSTLARIQRVIEELGRHPQTYGLSPETTIVSLQFDSLEFSQVVLDLEWEFEMDVAADDYRQLRTIADLVKYADSHSKVS